MTKRSGIPEHIVVIADDAEADGITDALEDQVKFIGASAPRAVLCTCRRRPRAQRVDRLLLYAPTPATASSKSKAEWDQRCYRPSTNHILGVNASGASLVGVEIDVAF